MSYIQDIMSNMTAAKKTMIESVQRIEPARLDGV